jgi:hypothetical protein
MNVNPDLPTFSQPSTQIPMTDVHALQSYLESMRAEMASQLQNVNQRLDTVANDAVSSSSHASHPFSYPPSGRIGVASGTRSATEVLGKLLNKPSQFHGEHGNRVYDWLSELDILFDNVGTTSDLEKITFARQCLRDEALRCQWRQSPRLSFLFVHLSAQLACSRSLTL